MAMQVVKATETLVVQVPASWSARDIRLEQSRVTRYMAKQNAHGHVILVGGGSEPQAVTPLQAAVSSLEETAADDDDAEAV